MDIEKILRIILAAAAVLSFAVGSAAFRAAGNRRVKTMISALVWIWCLAVVIAGAVFTAKVGPIVGAEGCLLAIAPASALWGGLLGGQSSQTPGRRKLAVAIALVLVCLDLTAFYAMNHRVVELVHTIGLDAKRVKYEPSTNKACPDNLKSLYFAFDKYVEGNGSLPPADKWMENEELASKVQKDEWFHCPEVSNRHDSSFGYAYNDAVAGKSLNGKKLAEMPNATRTPLLYDSANLDKSAHDSFSSMPKQGRHGGRNNVLYCDGHVEAVEASH